MSTPARHRIQAVAELTGVPPATLRAWERRYGIPAPHRTSSAYRLYSDQDVELVRAMGALVANGVPPSEAARRLALRVQPASEPSAGDGYGAMVARISAAVRDFDTAALSSELRRLVLLADGHAAFSRVLAPVLANIGTMWEAGQISIANEHVASHLITATVLDLLRTASIPLDAPTVLLACLSDEQHTLPLLGAALATVAWGLRPIILGARTPPSAIEAALPSFRPALIGLSATLPPEPASAGRKLIESYAAVCGTTPWVVGGAAAEGLRAVIEARGGHVVPADSTAARALLHGLVRKEPRGSNGGRTRRG